MHPTRREFLAAATGAAVASAQPPLYEPHQLDFHFHSGMEREVPMDQWVDLAVAGGRRVFLMVDHLELYRKGEEGHRLDNYEISPAGRRAFLDDVSRMKRRRGARIFSGWEVFEGELDTGVEWDAMRQVDAIGWHISHLKGKRPPDGKLLVHRARQIKELQKKLPVPMILLHPFTPRFEGLRKALGTPAPADYRYFRGDEQKQLIDVLVGSSIHVELNHSSMSGPWKEPVLRDALLAAIRPLAEAGLSFTAGSDNHSLASVKMPYRPEVFCEACGIHARQLNGIVRELESAAGRAG
jgi:histidinol phosphatase-like PHP family hydrolase